MFSGMNGSEYVRRGTVDPSAGSGVSALVGTLFQRDNSGTGTLYMKTGTGDTAWTQVVSATFTGNISATRFLADDTADSNSAPAFSWQGDDNSGIYNEAAEQVSITLNGTRYFRARVPGVTVFSTEFDQTNQSKMSGDISPTSLSAQADNYSPTSLGSANGIRQDASAPVTITGLDGGEDGRLIVFHNISSSAITLAHENASSDAANRFDLSGAANRVVASRESVLLQYDSTSSRWRVITGG